MLYSNIYAKPSLKKINGKKEYCVVLGEGYSKRPLILICDKDVVIRKGVNKNLSIEYYNDRYYKIRKLNGSYETTCYFLLTANLEVNRKGKIKITKKAYPHCSILAKGYDNYEIGNYSNKADYVLMRAPSWYGIIRIKTIIEDSFYNTIYIVRNSKVYKCETQNLKEKLNELNIEEDFVIYLNGNFDGKYWVTL